MNWKIVPFFILLSLKAVMMIVLSKTSFGRIWKTEGQEENFTCSVGPQGAAELLWKFLNCF
jgi:ribose/xylose/arabinose/galactoside ABC-type transport system permease subunit